MAISIEGGCQRCGMFTYNSKEQYDANKNKKDERRTIHVKIG